MPAKSPCSPVLVVFGDEPFQKAAAIQRELDALLPPAVDRSLALVTYDGTRPVDQGGPALAAVFDDLNTLPFLADRRVVLIRDADQFIAAHRECLERYVESPSSTGVLVLECRSFPRNTRLYKAIAARGRIHECAKLYGRDLIDFVIAEARARGQRMDYDVAARLVDLVGSDQGALVSEVEKLSLYAAGRPAVTADDIAELVGLSREEKIFAVMDAAALGRLPLALRLWQQTLATDPAAAYKGVGGAAFVLRRWLAAHRMRSSGMSPREIAPKVLMWRREGELETILRRLPPTRVQSLLAQLADLDAEVKVGARSIERGVESLLVAIAQ